jgi:uncharacterized Zn-finger protein
MCFPIISLYTRTYLNNDMSINIYNIMRTFVERYLHKYIIFWIYILIMNKHHNKHRIVLLHINKIVSNSYKFAASLQEQLASRVVTCIEPGCGKSYTRPSDTIAHMHWHSEKWEHVCEGCELRFRYEGQLLNHKKTQHGEKRNECDVCKKSFSRLYYLKLHKRIHTGKEPF